MHAKLKRFLRRSSKTFEGVIRHSCLETYSNILRNPIKACFLIVPIEAIKSLLVKTLRKRFTSSESLMTFMISISVYMIVGCDWHWEIDDEVFPSILPIIGKKTEESTNRSTYNSRFFCMKKSLLWEN